MTQPRSAKYGIGDVVKHRIHPFRGVIFDVDPSVGSAAQVIAALDLEGVKVSSPGPHSIRMVTHRHISREDADEALVRTSKVVREMK